MVLEKPIYRGITKKGELGQFVDLRGGGVGKKEEGGVFEGELIPSCPLCWV